MLRYICTPKLVAFYLKEFTANKDGVSSLLFRFVFCLCLPFVSGVFRKAKMHALAIAECTESQEQIVRLMKKLTGADINVASSARKADTPYVGIKNFFPSPNYEFKLLDVNSPYYYQIATVNSDVLNLVVGDELYFSCFINNTLIGDSDDIKLRISVAGLLEGESSRVVKGEASELIASGIVTQDMIDAGSISFFLRIANASPIHNRIFCEYKNTFFTKNSEKINQLMTPYRSDNGAMVNYGTYANQVTLNVSLNGASEEEVKAYLSLLIPFYVDYKLNII